MAGEEYPESVDDTHGRVCGGVGACWQYLRWREQEGIIGGIMFLMLFGLPVALAGMAYGVYGVVRGHKVIGM